MATKPTGGGPGAAKDRAHEYVKAQVLTGAFPGGELISEGEVAAALGMSRTPVREAFLRLEAEGLFDARRKRPLPILPRRIGVVTSLTQSGVRNGDVKPGTALTLTVVFKNLGDVSSKLWGEGAMGTTIQ